MVMVVMVVRKRQIQWSNDDRAVHQFSGSSGISAFVLYLLNCKFVFVHSDILSDICKKGSILNSEK